MKSDLADAQSSTSPSTRSGYRPANASATMPPIDVPCTCARSTPIASNRPLMSSAQSSIEYSCSGRSDSP